MDQNALMKALDLVYEKAIEGIPGTDGIPGMGSVEDFARGYMEGDKPLEEKVNSLIGFQIAKASASGFVNGLGGLTTLPLTLPMNLLSVFYIQLQMSAAIAHMGGYNVRDDRVKTFCYLCLCGESATKLLRGAGITVSRKLTEQMIKNLSVEVIYKINKAVGFRLITKYGETGIIVLGRLVPLVGGVVGGTFDGVTTFAVGKAAERIFINGEEEQKDFVSNPRNPDADPFPKQKQLDSSKSESSQWSFDSFIEKELADAEDFLFGNDREGNSGETRRV